ncbi:MAG: hypothetical protein QMD11_05470 [Smithella sp.]|nr:hypothetical protein [Smithella sp.]
MHTAQKTLSGNPPGDMPVIVIIGLGIVAGMGWNSVAVPCVAWIIGRIKEAAQCEN